MPDPPRPAAQPILHSLRGIAGTLSLLIIAVLVVVVVSAWVATINSLHLSIWGALLVVVSVLLIYVGGPWILLGLPFLYLALSDRIERILEGARGGPPWYRKPSDIDTYPDEWSEAAAKAHNRIADLLNPEIDILQGLGIPPPKILAEPVFTLIPREDSLAKGDYVPGSLKVAFPQYSIPQHYYYHLFEENNRTGRKPSGLFVGPENKQVELAQDLLAQSPANVAKFSGSWFNRDPYDLFKRTQRTEAFLKNVGDVRDFLDRHMRQLFGYGPRLPLEKASRFDTGQFVDIHRRMGLFAYLASDTVPCEGKPPIPGWLSEHLVLRLPLPELFGSPSTVTLKTVLPPSTRPAVFEQFIDELRSFQTGFVFELMAASGSVWIQFTIKASAQQAFEDLVHTYFPDLVLSPSEPLNVTQPLRRISLGQKKPSLCIKVLRDFAVDPYSSLFYVLDSLPTDLTWCFQVIAMPVKNSAIQSVCEELERLADDEPFFQAWDARPFKQRALELRKKTPPWLVSLSTFSSKHSVSEGPVRRWLSQFETQNQALVESESAEVATIERNAQHAVLLNTEELVSLAHFPTADLPCERLEKTVGKMKAPPPIMTGKGSPIGVNQFRGSTTTVVIPDEVRDRHLYLVGKTRMGKTTLMLNLIVQDICSGKGVGVIDPHGDLANDILQYIPPERVKDTIFWDASDLSRPIGLNIMEVHTNEEIGMLADDLLVSFRRLSESWGDRMDGLLRFIFHTLLRCDGTTFFDVQRILINKEFRDDLVSRLDDPALVEFWRDQFKMYSKEALQPILSRMSKFVLSPVLTAALTQRESNLNFFDVLQNKKILLVRAPKGEIGEDTVKLLGSMIVSQIQLAVMRRAKVRREAREPFYLYVDEFQNFTTSAFDQILSEAGKYKLCLTLAHQFVSQLDERIRNAILGNVGTMLLLPSDANDARYLKAELGSYDVADLTDLSGMEHEALCRPPTKSSDTFKFKTLPPFEKPGTNFSQQIIEHSKEAYGRPLERRAVQRVMGSTRPAEPIKHTSEPQKEGTHLQVAKPPLPRHPIHTNQKDVEESKPLQSKPFSIESTPGRGGMAHKQLQYLIQNFGKKYGYNATIEKQILGGDASVDVALEKGDLTIACQVCDSNTAEYEAKSIQKCLEAGFSAVVLLSGNRKTLSRARDLVTAAVPEKDAKRVRMLALEEFNSFLVELEAAGATQEKVVAGMKVSVSYRVPSTDDQKMKSDEIGRAVAESFRRVGKVES